MTALKLPDGTIVRRIQRRRVKDWRKPEGAVIVDRTSRWGNPIRWRDYLHVDRGTDIDGEPYEPYSPWQARYFAVVDFESVVRHKIGPWFESYPTEEEIREHLAGHDLACWCPPDSPCHGDVLLMLANPDGVEATR